MKAMPALCLFIILGLMLTVTQPLAHAQGSLTPPGAPAPTMKTLAQVEPRIPIDSQPYTISSKGSYYVTTNLSGVLTISADQVTLDLMGYTLRSSSGDAISIPANQQDLVVKNGIISGSSIGVDARYLRGSNSRFQNLTVSDNSFCGLYIGSDCLVENCLLISNGTYGVQSSSAGRLEVRNCRILGSSTDGLVAAGGSRIIGNTIENCGADGLRLTGSGSIVEENIIKGNADNYDIAAGNQLHLIICEIPETLDWPCTVSLAGTLTCSVSGTDGLEINSDNVTIDMGGHTLVGSGSTSGYGIFQPRSYNNLRVSNGKFANWRGTTRGGIYALGTGTLLSDLQATSNYFGLYVSKGSTVQNCIAGHSTSHGIALGTGATASGLLVYSNGANGINSGNGCVLSESTSYGNSENGIEAEDHCSVTRCVAYENDGDGITCVDATIIKECTVYTNAGYGIRMSDDGLIENCSASWNTEHGIKVYDSCLIRNSVSTHNGAGGYGAGIWAQGRRNRIEGNQLTFNDDGAFVQGADNFITRNGASGNSVNWRIDAGNVCLVVQAAGCGVITGSSGGTPPGSTDPNANFTY